jgi:hypothetical protein
MFWITKSIIDFIINLYKRIEDVFVVDITQCCENTFIERKKKWYLQYFYLSKMVFNNTIHSTFGQNIFYGLKLI